MAEQIKSLKTGIKYKDTPIGRIPVDWEVGKLGDMCTGQPEYGANVPAIDKDINLPRYIRITDITVDGKLLKDKWQSIQNKHAQPYMLMAGDLLFARSGATVGKTYLYRGEDGKGAFAGYMIRFKPNPKILLPEYLFHYTHSDVYYNWIKVMLRAGAQPNINAVEYSSMLIPIPPIAEQKIITETLTTVDKAIEKTNQIIEKTKEAKKGLMQRLLSHGIGHKKFKKTEIGSMPLEWEVVKLGEICDVLDNKRIPLNKDQRSRMAGNIPYYGANGVVDYINDHIFDDELILMAEDGGYFDEYEHRPIAYIVKGKCWVNNHAHILKVKAPNSTLWVYYSVVHKNIIPFIKGGTRAKLNQEDLKKILIPLPDLSEQQKMANNFSDIDTEIEKESNYKIQVQSVKNGLMQLLLTGIIRVKT